MVDREKSNQACSQGLSERLKEDRISELPDPLICHILSHLPTKEAVSTSVLSTRWKTLWLWVPKLKLDFREIRDFNAFVSFGDRFFDSSRVSWIDKLKLTIGKHDDDDGFKDTSYITSWIEAAVKRKVQHLRVDFYLRLYYEMPISLHVFEKLVSLKLFCVKLNDVEFVSFPCLKTMDLACVCLSKLSNDAFERLVSCCPVLEDLEIVHCWNVPQHLRVQSRSLKMLNIGHTFGCSQIENGQGVVIDAPLLCCLSIIDDRSKSFIVNNMEYNAKLEVDVTFGLKVTDEASISSGRSLIRSFLSGISKVGDLTIHPQTFKIIYNYSKSESLPQFGFMSRLCVSLYPSSIKGLLATFLESCPNLKSLVLELHYGYCLDGEEMPWEEMPECFQSLSLEFVDFKFPFRVYVDEMKLVRCFLENCVILKKLTVHLYSNPTKYEALKKLLELEIPTKCEFVIVEE